ncbi:hypothetical protein Tsubulata_050877 [Turnera subulata]|uniref:Cystatin domain-containing protein n=1 Tax=Turnera subulata TaxID=218843 RepID=A0A9Q0GF75_9ROSI|nr:hypothetical protein Tsubulata_050877 [Turnera subulata]
MLCLLLAAVTTDATLRGGWEPIKDLEDPHVREVAEYAVGEHGRLKNLQLKLEKIVKGEKQVVSGIMYRLVLVVEEKGAGTKQYTVIVAEDNKMLLKSFKKFVVE